MSELNGSSITLQVDDVLYNTRLGGAGIIQETNGANITISWFTGDMYGTERVVSDIEVRHSIRNSGEWERVGKSKEKTRRTKQFLESFFGTLQIGREYSVNDTMERLPPLEKYRIRGYVFGLFDPKGQLSKKGADIATYYSTVSDSFSPRTVREFLEKVGMKQFFKRADRIDNQVEFEKVFQLVDEKDVQIKMYPPGGVYLYFQDSNTTRDYKKQLEKKGFDVQLKKDARFSENQHPRALSVNFTN